MPRPYKTSRAARFDAYTKKVPAPAGVVGECWIWTRQIVDGYGRMHDEGRERQAHIVSYEHFVGPIPDGMELDHLCRRRACINPAHLEPVTHAENVRRGNAPTMIVKRTNICKKGLHKLAGDNVIQTSDGCRTCRACRAEAQRAWYLRKLAKMEGRKDGP
jgi:hypothetical protein